MMYKWCGRCVKFYDLDCDGNWTMTPCDQYDEIPDMEDFNDETDDKDE